MARRWRAPEGVDRNRSVFLAAAEPVVPNRLLLTAGAQALVLLSLAACAGGQVALAAGIDEVAGPTPSEVQNAGLEPRAEPNPPQPAPPGSSTPSESPSSKAPSTSESAEAKPSAGGDKPPLNAFWDYGPVFETSDKAFRFHIGGRLEFDSTWYQFTRTLPFQLQDGMDMRRARLRADGTFEDIIDFVTEVNFANIQEVTNESTTTQIGSVGLTDFYVTFKQVPVFGNVQLGHFKQPIGLEHLTSANYYYYMERSPGHDAFFQPFQRVDGVMFFDSLLEDRATAALSLARVGKNNVNPFAFGTGPGKYAATGRLTVLPIDEDEGRRLLHVGIGYSVTGTDNNNFGTANRPLVRAGAGSQDVPNILQTGNFFTPDPVQTADADLATVLGRFSMSAEYQLARGTNVFSDFENGVFSGPHGNATYQAVYAEVGFFLNPDDYRRYNRKEGVWGRQTTEAGVPPEAAPSRRRCAGHTPVQLLCRYSYLDLASGSPVITPSSGTQAGRENDITAGVDWFINPNVHFIINYVYTHLDYVNDTSGNIHGIGCRLHMDF